MAAENSVQRVFPITGAVQHYAWGGDVFLPALLGEKHPEGRAWAEYWLGVHPGGTATVSGAGGTEPLNRFIAREPEFTLGRPVRERFGSLPFLLKLLDVRSMLSIQVHPDAVQAREGFAREEAAGIPSDAETRNYKDDRHKPELLVALGEFWLLHGFRSKESMEAILQEVPELNPLTERFRQGYRALYETVLTLPQSEVNRMLRPLAGRILPEYRAGSLQKWDPSFWAARALETFCAGTDIDAGIFSIYLFNLVRLKEGEGLFQAAGMPHAYLEGQCVELMANSDNVLRAGLTPKHRDTGELLKLVRFEATEPRPLRRPPGTCAVFETPAAEFSLEQCRLRAGDRHFVYSETPAILLVTEGRGTAVDGGREMSFSAGSGFFCVAGAALMLLPETGAIVYTARVPEA